MALDKVTARKLLFTPCETRDQLGKWVKFFLGIHLPDCIVSDESNSCPLDLLWEIYSKAKSNDDPDFSRVMAFANRGGGKTLAASILEILLAIHLGRNVIHMAAVSDQSQKAQQYCRDHFSRPYLRDFRVGQNLKQIEFCRYFDESTGDSLTEKEWNELIEGKDNYTRIYNYLQIVLCTLQSTNGQHGEAMICDELDVIPKQHRQAYEESKHIPDSRDGMSPITLLTSTRKFSYGLVQEEISNAHKTGLHVRHWNAIDISEACLPERHLPELPKETYWIDDSNLKHVSEAEYLLLDAQSQKRFYSKEGYVGCKTCPLFSSCKGRLATHQKSTSKMLKSIPFVISKFKEVSTAGAITQILCRTPDTSGLILPKFNREMHMKSASKMAEIITSEKQNPNLTKTELLQLALDKGGKFYAGMDFGFTHNFAVVLGVVFGEFMFVVSVIAMPNLELDEKIEVCKVLKQFNPIIFGDIAYPSDIKTFKRRGFNMRDWSKFPGSVKAGIEIIRMKLMPAVGVPQLFFLKEDAGCEFLASQIQKYHFMTDASGNVSQEPDKEEDDEIDALRYLVMNVFAPKGKINLPYAKTVVDLTGDGFYSERQEDIFKTGLQSKIFELTSDSDDYLDSSTVKRGKFFFDI
jgi:hypothetical protein